MLNEERITNRMLNLIESGFFNKRNLLLTEAVELNDKDKIRIFQAAYNYFYKQNISVDGLRGPQTDGAIARVKGDYDKESLNNEGISQFYTDFANEFKKRNNRNIGKDSNDKTVNYGIQALISIAGQPVPIDGVIGDKTITAINTLTGSDTLNDDNFDELLRKKWDNRESMDLGIEEIQAINYQAKTNPNGKCTEGDCFNGKGTLEHTNGVKYIGTFSNGLFIGKNNQIIYDNGRFEGKTTQNSLDEAPVRVFGTYYYSDNSTYYGFFSNNKFNGNNSIYTNANGTKWQLDFVNGEPKELGNFSTADEVWKYLDSIKPISGKEVEILRYPLPPRSETTSSRSNTFVLGKPDDSERQWT